MILLDTNVFVGANVADDGLHKAASEALASLNVSVILHEYVYIETLTILSTRYGMEHVEKFLALVHAKIESGAIEFMLSRPEDVQHVTDFFVQHSRGRLSFTDVILLYLSQYYEIITFDKDLIKAIAKAKK